MTDGCRTRDERELDDFRAKENELEAREAHLTLLKESLNLKTQRLKTWQTKLRLKENELAEKEGKKQ